MLSASHGLGLPAWAALTAGNLSAFEPPARARRLVIAVDNDGAGYAACEKMKGRLESMLAIDVAPPPDGADDWNEWACPD